MLTRWLAVLCGVQSIETGLMEDFVEVVGVDVIKFSRCEVDLRYGKVN
jgi:hypothetical protein